LDKSYIEILTILGATKLEIERDSDDLSTLYERFSGAAADPYYYKKLEMDKLFLLISKLESLLSIPKRFKFAYEKIRGIEGPVPEIDPNKYAIKLLKDISLMLQKANKEGKVGYLPTWQNRF
jgi:hypothetical protein